ncbi:Lipid transfer protein [Zostera marina]|uniref:Non-specific lipid-transfer protein n=1 Tax=Zostera marina TaxID=29655 RepID=A0A0K9Q0M0_ZOSMR|nr:Lipid transfer protein [Zostera marina]
MASFTSNTKMHLSLFVVLLLATTHTASSFSCLGSLMSLISCQSYVTSQNNFPPPRSCCNAVTRLNARLTTTLLRQEACVCFKDYTSRMTNINDEKISSLPQACGLVLGFQIGTDINCTAIP